MRTQSNRSSLSLAAVAVLIAACGDSSTIEDTIVACQDGLDNDKDGLVDCKDVGCSKHSFCDPSLTKSCGDGVVADGERCDTKIAAGQPGACPTSCDDGNACTRDSLGNPGTCVAACVAAPITACEGGDGCCPTGCTSGSDSDCSASCGNGVLDPKETCDTKIPSGAVGTCPTATSCDDGNACTLDAVLNPGTCNASCGHQAMIVCVADKSDGCCPSGCNAATDKDCSPTCGNGVVEPKELCDTTIAAGQPGACPKSCDDKLACTQDQLLNGGTCAATCTNQAITQCSGQKGDGCCPTGCNAQSDVDCTASCGNGVVEANELCDTAIAAGQPGACPTSCDDKNACTTDTLLSAGTCTASCTSTPSTQCKAGDGCCPAGCNAVSDLDCKPVCGNGVVETGELCDTQIALGQPGACPNILTCDDKKPCTTDSVTSSGTCGAVCAYAAVTTCKTGDGCCPAGCTSATDKDCAALCGDGVLDVGELCDTKIPGGQPGACPSSCNDQDACTYDVLTGGGTCQAKCEHTPPSTICSGTVIDGCCPSSCNSLNDKDCLPVCGNGVVESGEWCDTGIQQGTGACPSSCDDGLPCTANNLLGSACTARCSFPAITTCSGTTTDGCCPAGCIRATDQDCLCGNGLVDPGETCDIAATSYPASCPTQGDCFDEESCTTDILLNPGTCQAQCTWSPGCSPVADGCCPWIFQCQNDPDCAN